MGSPNARPVRVSGIVLGPDPVGDLDEAVVQLIYELIGAARPGQVLLFTGHAIVLGVGDAVEAF